MKHRSAGSSDANEQPCSEEEHSEEPSSEAEDAVTSSVLMQVSMKQGLKLFGEKERRQLRMHFNSSMTGT
jgi:hypothetical protein